MVAAWAMALAGCTAAPRIPYTQQELSVAAVPGIPGARIWADDPSIASGRRSVVTRVPVLRPIVLALSGGGADGAFGAGLLAGWSARGTSERQLKNVPPRQIEGPRKPNRQKNKKSY